MTEEFFEYIEKLQAEEAEARQQKEKMYSQLLAEYNNLKRDNQQQRQDILNLQDLLRSAELTASHAQQENSRLQATIAQLQNKLSNSSNNIINDISKRGGRGIPSVLIEHSFEDSKEYKKKENILEERIKKLQDKLGDESVPLSVLAEGLKDYAEEAGIGETHELFNHLNNLLINVPSWTKNVPALKKFFKDARKEIEGRHITLTGNEAKYIENHGEEEK